MCNSLTCMVCVCVCVCDTDNHNRETEPVCEVGGSLVCLERVCKHNFNSMGERTRALLRLAKEQSVNLKPMCGSHFMTRGLGWHGFLARSLNRRHMIRLRTLIFLILGGLLWSFSRILNSTVTQPRAFSSVHRLVNFMSGKQVKNCPEKEPWLNYRGR